MNYSAVSYTCIVAYLLCRPYETANGAAPRPTRLQHMPGRSGFASIEPLQVLLGPDPGLGLLCPSILPVVGMPVSLLLRSKNEGILGTMLACPARPAVTAVLETMPASPTPRIQNGSGAATVVPQYSLP